MHAAVVRGLRSDGDDGGVAGNKDSVKSDILGAHGSDCGIPTVEVVTVDRRILRSYDLLADLRGNSLIELTVDIEVSGVGHELESFDCVVDSCSCCIDISLLGILLIGNVYGKSCIESRSGLCCVGLVIVRLSLLRLSALTAASYAV